jgi:predicted secreted protein
LGWFRYYFYDDGLYFMDMEHEVNSGLDHDRIEALTCNLLEHIRDNYRLGPISRNRVYEALNALAFCVATVVQGSEGKANGEARDFFNRALSMQLADLEKNPLKAK